MSKRGLVLFALLSVVWGVPYLMIKVAVAEVSVPFLVFARSALGAAVLLPLAFRDGRWSQLAAHWIPVTAFAMVEMIIPWGLLAHGEVRLSSSTAGLLIAATPILAVVLGKLLFRGAEPLSGRRLLGLAMGFGGVFVLAAPELGGDAWAISEVMLAATCYAAGSIIAGRWLADAPTVPMMFACLALAAFAYLPPAILAWPNTVPAARAVASIAGLAVVCTSLAFTWFFALIREIGAERAVVITYIAPAIAVAAGVVLLGEPLSGRMVIAFALILCGSKMATARTPHREAPCDAPRFC